jgi:exodeoxyribonuclease V gamma subunit
VEWLLRAPQHRFSASEWRDLLELPACARRFGIDAEALPQALDWLAGAGVRWGLGAAQRADLGLGATGETASWHFAVQRMLLGYAAGDLDDGFNGIEPYTEVAGLAATLAGALASMAREVDSWWLASKALRSPQDWAPLLRGLLASFFEPQDELDRAALAAVDTGLNSWLQACDAAGFEDPVPLPVVREAWLGSLQEPALKQRFKAGGVTFCTLLPLRAIPFDVVCLLGMNEGDYPRVAPAADFDLMALPGQGRPGDRSRRHDDRQLMLDALLSARRLLHISWVGRSQRDNTAQPPSVLVAQLRDYLDAGWGSGTSAQRTVEHPLQAFSRRYFEAVAGGADPRLFTYASEWRHAHTARAADKSLESLSEPVEKAPESRDHEPLNLTLAQLVALLRSPVRFYCRHHLKLVFGDDGQADLQDDESFDDSALERSQWLMRVLQAAPQQAVDQSLRRLAREACLPLASAGLVVQAQLREQASPMLAERDRILNAHPKSVRPLNVELHSADGSVRLADTVQGLWQDESGEMLAGVNFAAGALRVKGKARTDRLLSVWLQALACAAAEHVVQWHLIGPDHVAVLAPMQAHQAKEALQKLLLAANSSLIEGRLPATAARTGIAWLESMEGPKASEQVARREAKKAFEGDEFGRWGEAQEACLQRMYPTFELLIENPQFETDTRQLYGPVLDQLPGILQWDALPNARVMTLPAEVARAVKGRDD